MQNRFINVFSIVWKGHQVWHTRQMELFAAKPPVMVSFFRFETVLGSKDQVHETI
jgi:hypothetical protein